MKPNEIISKTQIEEQRLDEFFPLITGAIAGTAAGATLGDYILQKLKGAKDWSLGQSIGRNVERGERLLKKDVAPATEKLVKDIYKGYTGKDYDEEKEKEKQKMSEPDNIVPLPTKGIGFDELREQSLGKVLNKYELFLNENVLTVDDLAFIKDPNVRKFILAKASRESGGKNVGEISYKNTAPAQIRKALPQLAKYSDAELNALKQDTRKFFDVAYKGIGGYQYRGRGPIQITGLKNYQDIDKQLGLKGALVKDPDMLLRDPALAKAASLQYLKNTKLDQYQSKNEKDAAQRVIYAIGGPAYAPGTKRGNKELAAVEKIAPVVGATGTVVPAAVGKLPTVSSSPITDPALDTVTQTSQTAQTDKTTVPDVSPRFDYEAFRQAVKRGEDTEDDTRFLIPQTKPASLAEVTHTKVKNHKYKNGLKSKRMKSKKVAEAGTMSLDTVLGKGKDLASTAGLGALATQLPRVPELAKKIGARALPGLNIAYQAADAAQRAKMGDPVGAAIAAASAHPYLTIPGIAAQTIRDKSRTGSFFPDKEELEQAASKDQARGGYFKSRASDYDPSFLPENTQMKRLTNLRLSVIKEELQLKKCSMTEQQINERFFYYYDGKQTIFNEHGYVIGHVGPQGQVILNEASVPPWLKDLGPKLKQGWDWASTNIPPAYRKGKEIMGKGADELASLYQAGKGAATAVGRELVDVPASAAQKLKTAYQDVRYGTTPGMSPSERAKFIDDRIAARQIEKLGDIDVKTAAGKGKAEVKKADAEAEIPKQQARQTKAAADIAAGEVPVFSPRSKQMGKIAGIGTGVGLGADMGLQYAPGEGIPDYEVGKGFSQLLSPPTAPKGPPFKPEINEAVLRKKYQNFNLSEAETDSKTIAQRIRGALGLDKPEPPAPKPEPVKPAPEPVKPAPEPPKPAPPKPAPEPSKPDDKDGLDVPHSNLPSDYKPDRTQTGSDRVRAMQQKLKAAGYNLGKFGPEGDGVDGKWGKFTQRAYDSYMADKQAKQAVLKDPTRDPYDPKRDPTIKYTELPDPTDRPDFKTIKPTVPAKAYLDTAPDLSRIKYDSEDNDPILQVLKDKGVVNESKDSKYKKDLKEILRLAGRN